MNIAILTESLDSHSGSRAPLELAKSLAINNQNKLTIYTREKPAGCDIDNLPNKIKIKFIPKGSVFKIFLSLIRDFNSQNYDIMSSNATLSVFIPAALSKIPVVTTYHGTQWKVWANKLFPSSRFRKVTKTLDFCINILIWVKTLPIFLLSDFVVSISGYAKREARNTYFSKTKKIYWGASPKSLLNAGKNDSSKENTIISVSRITPYKGFHKLIEAFKKLDPKLNARLIICGSHPQKNYLKYLNNLTDEKITILLNVEDNTLKKLYAKAAIYATCDEYLFFGMPILEAASNGLPTVCLSYAAAKEVVKHGKTGFVANSELEFQKHIETLLKNKKLRAKLSRNAKAFALTFTWEKTAKEYEKIFRSVIKKTA